MQPESKTENTAIIIGAGIGGLATALALRQVGFEVKVLERVEEMKGLGAGLSLWANAVKALRRLGLDELVQAHNVLELGGGIYTSQGKQLALTSNRELERRFGAPTIAVHRAELQDVMLKTLGKDLVQLDHQLVKFEQDADKVTAHFANGQSLDGAVLIGADGLHSAVRAQLFGPEKPRYAGYSAWRGVVEKSHKEIMSGEFWGCGSRVGMVPLSQERVYWFATANAPEGAPDKPAGRKQELLERFGNWYPTIKEVIKATPEERILHNDIYDRPALKNWSVGRITLLGDAAHPMTPNMGQGACQALEDAVVLADCLKQASTIAEGLQLYQEKRLVRTSQIVKRSRQIGEVGQWANPLACWVRNTGVKLLPSNMQIKQLEPVLSYQL